MIKLCLSKKLFPLKEKQRHFFTGNFFGVFARGSNSNCLVDWIVGERTVFCLCVFPGNCTAIGVAADNYNVSDSQMTASSVYLQYYAYKGRLNGPLGWCQKYQHITNSDYLQIDMERLRYVCAVSTQGKKNGSWVTSYKLKFSTDGIIFTTYQENNVDKVWSKPLLFQNSS